MTNIAVPVPPSLQVYRSDFRMFVSGMVRKLDLNSHKNTPGREQIETMIELMKAEIDELEQQLAEDKFDQNALIENCDIANFAFLIFYALRSSGVETEDEKFIDEFYDVRPDIGRVYVKKTRPGSQYKMGDEVRGSRRNGYVDIKLSGNGHRIRLNRSSVPRSHLVWRAATGSWPTGIIDHANRDRSDDRISNLRDTTFSGNNLNSTKGHKYPPFVTCYKPSGREHIDSWGKFVYQRYHNGRNIRIGYFDTPEQAAIEGAARWYQQTGEIQ